MNLILAIALAAGVTRAEPAILEDYQVTAKQVTLKLSRPVGHRASTTADPPAIVLTLDDTRIAQAVQEKSVASVLVAGIAALPIAGPEGESARVIIKLAKKLEFTATPQGNDLIVDLLEPAAAQAPAPVPAPPLKAPPAAAQAPTTAPPDKVPATVEKPKKKAALYQVQVASFPEEAKAGELKKTLEGKAGPVEIRKVDVAGKPMFKVLVGPPQGRPAAKALAEKLKGLSHASFLYRLP